MKYKERTDGVGDLEREEIEKRERKLLREMERERQIE